MLQKNENMFRSTKERRLARFNYAEVISIALRQESLGRRGFEIAVANWTGASERTVTNWMNGASGPNGMYLIYLIRRSDEVLKTVLALAQRQEVLSTYYERERDKESERRSLSTDFGRSNHLFSGAVDPVFVPDGPNNDPDPYAERGVRQRWFVSQLLANRDVRAQHIAHAFGVSIKTGKRDIASLRGKRIIAYSGSARTGRYRLVT